MIEKSQPPLSKIPGSAPEIQYTGMSAVYMLTIICKLYNYFLIKELVIGS